MAIDQKNLLQSIRDLIRDSLTQPPSAPGGGPAGSSSAYPRSNTLVSLCFPFGQPIDPKQFDPSVSTLADENLAIFVDDIPRVSAFYEPNGNSVSTIYRQIVNSSVNPPPPPTPAQLAALNNAEAVLKQAVTIPSPIPGAPPMTLHQPSAKAAAYDVMQGQYNDAIITYGNAVRAIDLTTPAGIAQWNIVGTSLQAPVISAWNNWNVFGYRNEVEQARAVISQHGAGSVVKLFSEANQLMDAIGRPSAISPAPGLKYYPVMTYPAVWYTPAASAGFSDFEIRSSDLYYSSSSDFTSYGSSGGGGWGLWRVKGSSGGTWSSYDMDSSTTNIRIRFKLGRVDIRRPWLDFSLLTLGGWQAPGRAPGDFSTGTLDATNTKWFPLLPTAFMVATGVEVEANWGATDYSRAQSSTSGSASVSWGPFSASGNYHRSTSNVHFHSTMQGNTLKIPGFQIIAWVNTLIPKNPPL